MILSFLALSALAQGPAQLAYAESLLVAGDTAHAINALAAIPFSDTLVTDDALRATFALEWLGRAPQWERARSIWEHRAKLFHGPEPLRSPGAAIFATGLVDQRESDNSTLDLSKRKLLERMRGAAAEDTADGSVGAAARRWATFVWSLDELDNRLLRDVPFVAIPPRFCKRDASAPCDVRQDPPPEAKPLRTLVLGRDTLREYWSAAQAALARGMHDPWPFREMAARSALAMEILLGTDSTRLDLRARAAQLPLAPEVRSHMDAVLYAFSGRRDSAWMVMTAAPHDFQQYDTLVWMLQDRGRLPPPVLWRTGWPLYLEPYNERLVVHRARMATVPFLDMTLHSISGIFAPYTRHPELVRRGLPVAVAGYGDITKIKQSGPQLISYLDWRTAETLLPFHPDAEAVSLDVALAARALGMGGSLTGYVAERHDSIGYLENQVIRYERNGEVHVDFFAQPVRAPDALQPVPCADASAVAGFFLLGNNLGLVRRSVDTLPPGAMPALRYPLVMGPGAYVFSLEVVDPACHAAERARFPLQVPPPSRGLAMSDLVLADRADITNPTRVSGPLNVEARPGLSVAPGEQVHLYWEVYGLPSDGSDGMNRLKIEMQAVNVRARLVPTGQLGDVQRAANFAKPVAAVSYQASVPAGDGPLGMSLLLQMPPTTGGVHLVRVVVTDTKTGHRAEAARTFNVTRPRRQLRSR